jgi:hypothetical protein
MFSARDRSGLAPLVAVLVFACSKSPQYGDDPRVAFIDRPEFLEVIGTYDLSMSSLQLNADGRFIYELGGCCGSIGDAAGDWTLEDGFVVLDIQHSTGNVAPDSDRLAVGRFALRPEAVAESPHLILLPMDEPSRASFANYGAAEFTCFIPRSIGWCADCCAKPTDPRYRRR